MDRETFALMDYIQYRMFLSEVNKKNIPYWNISHRFTTYYGYPRPNAVAFADLAKKFLADAIVREKVFKMYNSEGPDWKKEIENKGIFCVILQ